MQIVLQLITNPLFVIPVFTVVLAQIVKQLFFWIRGEEITRYTLVTDGGMPSSHSALMSSLTTALFITQGLAPISYLALFTTLIVAKDAYGVRNESGKQARLLLEVMHRVHLNDPEHLKTLLGHTKFQVFVGLVFGVVTSLAGYAFFF